MHPRIAELLEYIDAQAAHLRAAFEAVPPDRRGVRPAPNRWSPAEVVHHLTIVERRVVSRLTAMIEEARALPPEHESSPVLPTMNTARYLDRSRKFVTSDAGEPKGTDPARVWDDFAETRQALRKLVLTGDGLALGKVAAPHPAFGPFSGYEWIAFAGGHAARHTEQIQET